MSDMLNRKISLVYKKAKERPKGYIDDIKSHSVSWNEKTGRYLITQENWDKLCLKYRNNPSYKIKTKPDVSVPKPNISSSVSTQKNIFQICQNCSEKESCDWYKQTPQEQFQILSNIPKNRKLIAKACKQQLWGGHFDFVWPWSQKPAVGAELLYSVRSVYTNFIGTPHFWFIGDRPSWLRESERVIYIPQKPVGKDYNFRILLPLLEHPQAPKQFCYMNDDILFVDKVLLPDLQKPKIVKSFTYEELDSWQPKGTWAKRKKASALLLRDNKKPFHNFSTHLPQIFEKEKLLQTGEKYQLTQKRLLLEFLYFNEHCDTAPEPLHFSTDNWLYRTTKQFDEKLYHQAKFCNYNNTTYSPEFLQTQFPQITPVERVYKAQTAPMIKAISHIKSPKVILDIGSRDGKQAVEFAEAYPQAQVYAFECAYNGIKKTKKRLKNIPNCHLVPKAVSNQTQDVKFYSVPTLGCCSLLQSTDEYAAFQHWEGHTNKTYTVPATRIDDWAKENQITQIDLVWMDVQGAELLALQGFGTLLKSVKAAHIEVRWPEKNQYKNQPTQESVIQFMEKAGFVEVYRKANKRKWDGNILFIKKNTTKPSNSLKCSFASCGCKGKPITCNHIANKDNLCPNKFDMDCEFRNKPSAEILPFYQTRKDICNKCKNPPKDCPILHQTPCSINRILNDPKHKCPLKLWDRESDHIFYDYKGKSITETEWKKKKQEKEENPV